MPTRSFSQIAAATVLVLATAMLSGSIGTADAGAGQARVASQAVVPGDEARGCCLFKSSPPRCSYSNRGYCRTTAAANNLRYEFYEDTRCRDVAACPIEP